MSRTALVLALREQHEAMMIQQAETIRTWPIGHERHEQAMIHIRQALWERGLGRISDATQYRIYSILNFAMPDNSNHTDNTKPLGELEKEAAYEAAYFEQLERQSCPECGDGLCPVDDDCPTSPTQ